MILDTYIIDIRYILDNFLKKYYFFIGKLLNMINVYYFLMKILIIFHKFLFWILHVIIKKIKLANDIHKKNITSIYFN